MDGMSAERWSCLLTVLVLSGLALAHPLPFLRVMLAGAQLLGIL